MNSRERLIAALELKIPDRIPVFENSIAPNVIEAIIGKNNLLEMVEFLDLDGIAVTINYKKDFKGSCEYVDEFGILRRVGQTYDMQLNYPIKSMDDLISYRWPDPKEKEKFVNISKAADYFGASRAVIVLLRDVFSNPRDLMGFENFLMSFYENKPLVIELIKKSVEYSIILAQKAKDAGADIVLATDDYADNKGPMINPKLFEEIFAPQLKLLFSEYKKAGLKIIKHTDGDILSIVDYIIESGIDCIDPVDPLAGMDLDFFKKNFGSKICIKGNVDCATTLVNGSISDVSEEVRNCIIKAAGKGGYILSSSNSIHSGVKPDNFMAMVEAARKYGKY
ncbi:MAG: hypothetical protein JW997_05170 [Actinobacteria bacterium]|nr:hypothetical protein [Actinomycetota bacterium]